MNRDRSGFGESSYWIAKELDLSDVYVTFYLI